MRRGENRRTRRKTSRSKDENQQQTQPTFDAESGNRARATLVGGLRGRQVLNHCAIPAPLEAYSRRENIKFFNIPEAREEDTEEVLRNFMERDLGYRNVRSVEIQRVHRLTTRRNSGTVPRPIIARLLRYKDVEEIFSLGRRLEESDIQMFRDLPLEIIKRRKDQMAVFKEARRQGMRAFLSKSQPDKLFINGKFWPPGKRLDAAEEADE